jgi:tRNA modification GTPase
VLVVIDGSEALTDDDQLLLEQTAGHRRIVVANKADRPAAAGAAPLLISAALPISATRGDGLDELRRAIAHQLTGEESLHDSPDISNTRHVTLLEEALAHLEAARDAAGAERTPEEFLLSDLQAARARFDEVVGVRTSEDVLRHIFEKFCIGK